MNGPMWSEGLESALKSGTSLPAHFLVVSFHHTCSRVDPRACRSNRTKRGCKARGGWPARTMPSSGKHPARTDPLFRAAGSCSRFGKRPGVDPVSANGRSIVAQERKARHLLPSLDGSLRRIVGDISSALPFSSLATSASEGL